MSGTSTCCWKLLQHIWDNDLVNPASYGTMTGGSSFDPVFVRELEYEMCRSTRRPLVHFDNDATSCYDRIPCFLANLASHKCGMDKRVCVVQAQTLQEAKCYLRTRLGISAECAEHTRECPWFGTGQGSGNSPFYWLIISSTLCIAPKLRGVQPTPAPTETCAPLRTFWDLSMM